MMHRHLHKSAIHLMVQIVVCITHSSTASLRSAVDPSSQDSTTNFSSSCDPSAGSCLLPSRQQTLAVTLPPNDILPSSPPLDLTDSGVEESSVEDGESSLKNNSASGFNSSSMSNSNISVQSSASYQNRSRFHLRLPSLKLIQGDFFSITDRINALRNLFESIMNLERELIWNPIVPSRMSRGSFLVRLFSNLIKIMPFHEVSCNTRYEEGLQFSFFLLLFPSAFSYFSLYCHSIFGVSLLFSWSLCQVVSDMIYSEKWKGAFFLWKREEEEGWHGIFYTQTRSTHSSFLCIMNQWGGVLSLSVWWQLFPSTTKTMMQLAVGKKEEENSDMKYVNKLCCHTMTEGHEGVLLPVNICIPIVLLFCLLFPSFTTHRPLFVERIPFERKTHSFVEWTEDRTSDRRESKGNGGDARNSNPIQKHEKVIHFHNLLPFSHQTTTCYCGFRHSQWCTFGPFL